MKQLLEERIQNINDYTPAIQQHIKIKHEYRDCILFFQLGDFFEVLFEDAELVARELEIALTSKNCGSGRKASMAGVPIHSYEPYLYKMIEKGYKVALVEQLQDPKNVKGVVERGVTRVVSKGTINEGSNLSDKDNNYIMSITISNNKFETTLADVSTGDVKIATYENEDEVYNAIFNFKPSEAIITDKAKGMLKALNNDLSIIISVYNDESDNQFIEDNLNSYKEYISLHLLFNYLTYTQKRELKHLNEVSLLDKEESMKLDYFTVQNLELVENLHEKKKKGSLLWVLDKTITASGGRLLKQWIQNPSISKNEIEKRLEAVEETVNQPFVLDDIKELLKSVYDLERILSKISFGTINPKDLKALSQSLSILPDLKSILHEKFENKYMKNIVSYLSDVEQLVDLLQNALVDTPPMTVRDGGIFKEGFNSSLDNIKNTQINGKEWLATFSNEEKEKYNIPTLKVKYSKSFGYFIEVSKKQSDLVPDHYNRLQTLVNAERYTTEILVQKADDILNADDKIKNMEYDLFQSLKNEVKKNLLDIKKISNGLSKIDVISALASIAIDERYIKPSIVSGKENYLYAEKLRHPVAEKMMDNYIPNDVLFDDKEQMMLITGPNASGKSTFMKSCATSMILAQIGSFVPAEKFEFSLTDRVFTRIGASDDLFNHQSTFMMEMSEINQALKYGTNRSFIIIDELGRGTSTDEGIAIAKSIIHYIHNHKQSRSMIATHYHELTELENELKLIKNYSMQVHEEEEDVVFLHEMKPGKAGKSYAIYCAKLCDLPNEVIKNAHYHLKEQKKLVDTSDKQISLFDDIKQDKEETNIEKVDNELEGIADTIKNIDVLNTTPLEALSI